MSHSRDKDRAENSSSTSRLVDSVDQMVRLPLEMTGATWDLMMQGMQNMTGTRSERPSNSSTGSSSGTSDASGSSWTAAVTGQSDQDLSGDDLKYVMWSVVFTKPGFETVLEPQHEEIVNYSADGASFAAVKIARFLERARHGHADKPESWGETYPTSASKRGGRRTEAISAHGSSTDADEGASASSERGWRIPPEDHKYITFLYRVDRRLPKQDAEVTRVERVTIERGGASKF